MKPRLAAVLVMALCCLRCFGAETRPRACEKGSGTVREKVKGFTITIDPVPGGSQLCRALISKKTVTIFATQAPSIRLKMFGGDMNGDKQPEVAVETDSGATTACCVLHVISLGKPPGLLRTISKGRYFSVEDRDGDRLYEIWAGDADGFDGFDGLQKARMEIIPTAVLRFRGPQLGDAGAEFYYLYDSMIARLRVALAAERMKGFLASDGKLADGPNGDADLAKLRETKGLILNLAEHYLYSGRADRARASLGDLWPSADVERIWSLMQDTRKRGIVSQVDFTFPMPPPFEGCGSLISSETVGRVGRGTTPPKPIKTGDPEYSEAARKAALQGTVVLWAVICADGRVGDVRIQKSLGHGLDQKAIEAVRRWRFEPARKDGVPVPVQVNIEVNFRLF